MLVKNSINKKLFWQLSKALASLLEFQTHWKRSSLGILWVFNDKPMDLIATIEEHLSHTLSINMLLTLWWEPTHWSWLAHKNHAQIIFLAPILFPSETLFSIEIKGKTQTKFFNIKWNRNLRKEIISSAHLSAEAMHWPSYNLQQILRENSDQFYF